MGNFGVVWRIEKHWKSVLQCTQQKIDHSVELNRQWNEAKWVNQSSIMAQHQHSLTTC